MTTYYFEYENETIERITEQMIEEELLKMIEEKVSDVSTLYDDAIVSLKDDNDNIERLYEETLKLVEGTKERIKENIRQYIESEHSVVVIEDDGDGNIVFGLVKEGE